MRRPVLIALATLIASGVAAPPATAASSYCSGTGDVCFEAKRHQGVVRLRLGTFSFSGPVRVCVTDPARSRTCRTFRLRRLPRGLRGMDARWSAHFPHRGPGTYRVGFSYAGSVIGPSVSFTLRRP